MHNQTYFTDFFYICFNVNICIMPIYDLVNPNKYVEKPVYQKRLSLCDSCPERLESNKKKLNKFSRCPMCGCIISLKAKLSTEECPLGDW